MVVVALIALILAAAAGFAYLAAVEPRLRRGRNVEKIGVYGYVERLPVESTPERPRGRLLNLVASSIGGATARRLRGGREDELQHDLLAAGLFRVGARRFLGYRVLLTVVLVVGFVSLTIALGGSGPKLVAAAIVGIGLGWAMPSFVVHRRARLRLQRIDDSVPELIDLLVVTLEAGVGFTAALRMSVDRLEGPLGDEVRLTIQEQALGLSTLDALKNWLERCDTPSVRSFVRAMVQGERLGVSIGQILRNQAEEMRSRRKFVIEERAQKTPVKILFPLIFLIFPAMFIIILGSAFFSLSSEFK